MKQLYVTNGKIQLPKNIIDKYNLSDTEKFYLKETPYGLILLRPTNDIKRVYLEVTNRCNLACSICIRNTWQEPMGDMDWKTVSALIKQSKLFFKISTSSIQGKKKVTKRNKRN